MPSDLQRRDLAVHLVLDERDRQERLVDMGRFTHTCAMPAMPADAKLAVLVEEVGEVGRAMNEMDAAQLKVEMVHVAAVAFAWLESLVEPAS